MKYSNRQHDINIDSRVRYILDSIYNFENIHYIRAPNRNFDIHGVDVIMRSKRTDSLMWVDEKCATHYWDKDLNTFSCELTCSKTKNGLGWFAQENNPFSSTTHYMFVWVRASEQGLIHLDSVEFMIVNKYDLQKYFNLCVGCDNNISTTELIDKVLGNNKWIQFNSDIKIKRCDIYPEFPVNVIFSKELLQNLSIWHKIYSKDYINEVMKI